MSCQKIFLSKNLYPKTQTLGLKTPILKNLRALLEFWAPCRKSEMSAAKYRRLRFSSLTLRALSLINFYIIITITLLIATFCSVYFFNPRRCCCRYDCTIDCPTSPQIGKVVELELTLSKSAHRLSRRYIPVISVKCLSLGT